MEEEGKVPSLEDACVLLLGEVLAAEQANNRLIKVSMAMVLAATYRLKAQRLQTILATQKLHEMAFKKGLKIKQ